MSTQIKTSQLSSIDTAVLSSIYFVVLDETNTTQTSSGSTVKVSGDEIALTFWGMSADYIPPLVDITYMASLSSNWQTSYTTVSTNSATWQSPIYTPGIYYVETYGNDATGQVGRPTKPYLTATAAYDAGVASGQNFVIHLGIGGFSLILNGNISSALLGINGEGVGTVTDIGSYLDVNAVPSTVYNSNGTNGYTVNLHIHNLGVSVDCTGGSIDIYDDGSYTAGTGGSMDIRGNGRVFNLRAVGGTGSASAGTATGGMGGMVNIHDVDARSSLLTTEGGIGSSLSNNSSGDIYINNCDCRGSTIIAETSYVGRSFINSDISISDLGGNAIQAV